MKKLILLLLFVFLVARPCAAAFTTSVDNKHTYQNSYRWTGKSKDLLLDWAQEVEDRIDGTIGVTHLHLIPGTGATVASQGDVRLTAGNNLQYYTTEWQTLAASTSSTLDEAYDAGQSITVDSAVIALTSSDALNAAVLAIDQKDTGAYNAFTITGDATKPLIDLDQDGTGGDIEGSDASWSVSKAADTINGDTAGHYIINDSIDTDGVGVMIYAVDATDWYAAYLGGAAWTEE